MRLTPPPLPSAPVLVGFSGGLDSTVLLHLLAADPDARGRGLRALHVHHGLHADADAWERHCLDMCSALHLPLTVARVEVPADTGEGLEAAARHARYRAFAATLRAGEALALAHHQQDQAETFLLRALRASGVDGLGAMRAWRAFGHGWLWRPLLDTPRAELHEYAQQHGLHWIDDPANADDHHDRVFLRQQVMPLLRQRWSQADAALARSATLQREAAVLLDDGDALALAEIRSLDPACVRIDGLLRLPAERRARVLRRWIADCGLPPLPAQGVARIDGELLRAADDAVPEFGWRDAVVRRWHGLLWAEVRRAPLPTDYSVRWDGREPLALPGGGELILESPLADAQQHCWHVHARRGGERITLPGRSHSHALKQVLQSLAVPPWLRARMPLLSSADGELLAAGDVVFSAGCNAWLRERGQRLRWQQPTWKPTCGPAPSVIPSASEG